MAVIGSAVSVSTDVVPVGVVVPLSAGLISIVRFAVGGITAKFAVTVASAVTVAVVSDKSSSAIAAPPVAVQLTNM